MAADNDPLRPIFADPTMTDLYYGADDLCRSYVRLSNPSDFISEALRRHRAQIAAYQTRRLQELMPGVQSVVEIGPGMGRAAYFGYLAGLDYTTIDLPLGIVAQACFLGRALSPDAVWFAGEDQIPDNGRIKLLYGTPNRCFDAALNVDSITEMPAATAFEYFSWAAAHTRYLLSINHAKNYFTVSELATVLIAAQIIARRACPVWDGYAEELFSFRGRALMPRSLGFATFWTLVTARRLRRHLPSFFKRSASCS